MGEDRGDRAEDNEPVRKMTTARTDQKSRKTDNNEGYCPPPRSLEERDILGVQVQNECPANRKLKRDIVQNHVPPATH